VGLLAALISATCVGFADTAAYFTGKYLGKTQLIKISPKKTVEGAIGGLCATVGIALCGWRFAGWPGTPVYACALGTLVFVSSIFGDLLESVIKREAGLKVIVSLSREGDM